MRLSKVLSVCLGLNCDSLILMKRSNKHDTELCGRKGKGLIFRVVNNVDAVCFRIIPVPLRSRVGSIVFSGELEIGVIVFPRRQAGALLL